MLLPLACFVYWWMVNVTVQRTTSPFLVSVWCHFPMKCLCSNLISPLLLGISIISGLHIYQYSLKHPWTLILHMWSVSEDSYPSGHTHSQRIHTSIVKGSICFHIFDRCWWICLQSISTSILITPKLPSGNAQFLKSLPTLDIILVSYCFYHNLLYISCSVLFVVVHLLSHFWLFATLWTTARQACLSVTISWSLLKLMSIKSVVPSNHLILCHPLLLLPSVFPSIRVFSNESALTLGDQSIGASTSVLPMNIPDFL